MYAKRVENDGLRILVDRIWPRGISKARARIDKWEKEWAPSTALRQWFGHDPRKWTVFRTRYLGELRASKQRASLKELAQYAKRRKVTLVYSAADEHHNQAVVLRELLEGL
ncbi:MAG TPA: DUF488 family protein [Nitrospiraceae bacterium]|nr:DUF488 family protein [Nitrospiraceae bacterium]